MMRITMLFIVVCFLLFITSTNFPKSLNNPALKYQNLKNVCDSPQFQEIESLLSAIKAAKNAGKPANSPEIIALANKAINLTIQYFNISTKYTTGIIRYDPLIGSANGETTVELTENGLRGAVRIGIEGLLKGTGSLASTLFHEAEGHGKQAVENRWYPKVSGCNHVGHVMIYDSQIASRDKFCLSIADINRLTSKRGYYYGLNLYPEYRKRIDEGDFSVRTRHSKISFKEIPELSKVNEQYVEQGVLFTGKENDIINFARGFTKNYRNGTRYLIPCKDYEATKAFILRTYDVVQGNITADNVVDSIDTYKELTRGTIVIKFVDPKQPLMDSPALRASFDIDVESPFGVYPLDVNIFQKTIDQSNNLVIIPVEYHISQKPDPVKVTFSNPSFPVYELIIEPTRNNSSFKITNLEFEQVEENCGLPEIKQGSDIITFQNLPRKLISDSFTLVVSTNLNSNIPIKKGSKVTLSATGKIEFGAFAGVGSPEGIQGFRAYNKIKGINHGILLARIRKNGEENWFVIGKGASFIAPSDGTLELLVNDDQINDNEGAFTVEVEIDDTTPK